MGFSFHGHKRDVDAEKHLRRMHKTTPLIDSPLAGADHDTLVFSQRHEANSIELFFDLFFVANLATFTAYHSITDLSYLAAYIGFFGILWSLWFQITLHDVRFARDSLYERVCKTIQFIGFVGLALVGSKFNPLAAKGDNVNFQILCFVLVMTRVLLAVQYMVVLFYVVKAKYQKLITPLALMVGVYSLCAAAFGAMTPGFSGNKNRPYLYIIWYIVMGFEAVVVIGISCYWRMLSFKKTHLMERMSLLTIIVIGEGAIGVTKTVGKLMGKHGLDMENTFLVMCIVGILVLIYAMYFDNFPHGHYGTIRQQIWSLLHFPFHLAIVGVVEGSQQIAQARYVSKNQLKVGKAIMDACQKLHLDGAKLRDALLKQVMYYELDSKIETKYSYYFTAVEAAEQAGNSAGICSAANATSYGTTLDTFPDSFWNLNYDIVNGLFTGLGMKIPVDKTNYMSPVEIGFKSWSTVYMYFWSSFIGLLICSILFLILIRRHKADIFDYTSIVYRGLAIGSGVAMLCLQASPMRLSRVIASPAILPIVVVVLFLMLCVDKVTSVFANHQLKKSGAPFALEFHEEHHGGGHEEHGGHDENHGAAHEVAHSHSSSDVDEIQKAARWSTHPDVEAAAHEAQPLRQNMTPPPVQGH